MVKKVVAKTKTVKKTKTIAKTNNSLTVPVLNLKGEETGVLEVPREIAEVKSNKALLAQAVYIYLSTQRKGGASTKTRAEVSGGGRKPWKQKGTGRARQGSIRAPHWRGGGITFGPRPKDFTLHLPNKMRRLAILAGLKQKISEKNVYVADKLEEINGKTKEVKKIINNDNNKTLIISDSVHKNIIMAIRNLKKVTVKNLKIVNVYDLLTNDKIIFTKSAFKSLDEIYKFAKKEEK